MGPKVNTRPLAFGRKRALTLHTRVLIIESWDSDLEWTQTEIYLGRLPRGVEWNRTNGSAHCRERPCVNVKSFVVEGESGTDGAQWLVSTKHCSVG